jgi:hypothetical protein
MQVLMVRSSGDHAISRHGRRYSIVTVTTTIIIIITIIIITIIITTTFD